MNINNSNQNILKIIKKFSKVSLLQRIRDIFSGIFHGLNINNIESDPLIKYNEYLLHMIESNRCSLQLDIDNEINVKSAIEKKYEIHTLNFNQAEKDFFKIRLAAFDSELSEIENYKSPQMISLEEYYTTSKEIYKKWHTCLQRATFNEKFDFRKLFVTTNKKHKFANFSFSNSFSSILFKFCPYIFIPLESYFVYPAFQFITEDNIQLAISAAILFVGILYGLGFLFGMLMLRSRETIVLNVNNTEYQDYTIKSIYKTHYCIMSIVILLLSIMISFSGASLREIVYDVAHYNSRSEQLDKSLKELKTNLFDEEAKQSETEVRRLKNEITKKETDISENKSNINIIRKIILLPDTKDWWVAFSMYLGLFSLSMGSYIISHDPYPEYDCIREELRSIERAIEYIKQEQNVNIKKVKKRISVTKSTISVLEKVIARMEQPSSVSNTEKNSAYNLKLKEFDSASTAWKISRMVTFTILYKIFANFKNRKEEK